MPQIRSVHAVFVFAILLCHTTVFAQTRTGTIRGRVLAADGSPAINVPVAAFAQPDSQGLSEIDPISTGTTDGQGRYSLSGLAAGRYKVLPNVGSQWDVISSAMDAAAEIAVRAGREAVQDIVLRSFRGVTVSGRVIGDPLLDNQKTVFLGTEARVLRTDVAFDGTFSFQDVSPGTYSLTVSVPQFVWGATEIQVTNQNVTGLELIPDESVPVKGRVITDGGGPVPRLMFFLDGVNGSTHTRYIWVRDSLRSSGMIGVSGWADKPDDVIFNASLPIGEYRISLVNLPAGYRVKSFTYGTTDLLENALRLEGEIQQLSIVLSAPEPSPLVRVRGRLVYDASVPAQIVLDRVVLQSNGLLTPLEATVSRDGSFEISGVPPGIYNVTEPPVRLRLAVGDEDVRGVEIRASRLRSGDQAVHAAEAPPPTATMPASRATPVVQRIISGRIDAEVGMAYANLTLKPVAGNEDIFISFSDAGAFSRSVAEGEYRVSVRDLEERYEIQSITYGSANLRMEPLRITGDSGDVLVVTARVKTQERVTVSGRISGAEPAILNVARVFLSGGSEQFAVSPDSDGRFIFSGVPSGFYEMFANTNGQPYPSAPDTRTLVVGEDDIEGAVLHLPRARKTVSGRIVVDGGYPMPSVALTVRPDVDSGPRFSDPYTLRSGLAISGGFVIGHDGRFTIELPEGHHRLRVDGYPGYRVKSVKYGSVDLRKDLLRIEEGNLKELVISFNAVPPVPWPKVKGRVDGFGNVNEPVRVMLESTRTGYQIEAAPRRDGFFEFSKVPPDTYTVWFVPRVAMTSPRTLVVADRDVESVDVRIPAQRTIDLRITTDAGIPRPRLSLGLAVHRTEAYIIHLDIPFVLRTANEMLCVSDVCTSRRDRSLGEPAVISASPGDGKFVLKLTEGEYRAELSRIPAGYALQSFTQGTVDLREQPLRVGPMAEEIVVHLRRQ